MDRLENKEKTVRIGCISNKLVNYDLHAFELNKIQNR